jgi:predicted dehydrogenase
MNIAFVGCGYVADFYATTLQNHSDLRLAAVWDVDEARMEAFSAFWNVNSADSMEALLQDPLIGLVVNLTNPKSHFAVSQAALEAGKHVYSEKPLALSLKEAIELTELSERRSLQLGSAPCTYLGEAAQTAWKAVRSGRIGTPRLAYAELDDGPIHLLGMETWRSESGVPWPYADELEVGCTLEHAGYYVSWLLAMFGPVKRVTACNTLVVPDKGVPTPQRSDLSVGVLEHVSGMTSRITCSLYGTHDHSLRVFGDEGVLSVSECWDYGTSVGIFPRKGITLKAEKRLANAHRAHFGLVPVPLVRKPKFEWKSRGANRMDFARGIAEIVEAHGQRRPSRLSAQFSLHLNEIVLALDSANPGGRCVSMQTTCEIPSPMPWAT